MSGRVRVAGSASYEEIRVLTERASDPGVRERAYRPTEISVLLAARCAGAELGGRMGTQSPFLAVHPSITLARPHGQPNVDHHDDGRAMARAVVDALREPALLLDGRLRVVAANRAYCLAFKAGRRDILGRPVQAISDGRWNTAEVRAMLGRIWKRSISADSHEMEQDLPSAGPRTLIVHASGSVEEARSRRLLLLSIEDVSERRVAERESAKLLQQMETLLLANQHQIANSLQIIASIILLKARSVQSQETRTHLENVHYRVLSVATAQRRLLGTNDAGRIALAPYLSQVCEALSTSMVAEQRSVSIDCRVDGGTVSATEAVSLGLIVTELVINALKHAFFDDRAAGRIDVTYELSGDAWRLAVSDNGLGKRSGASTSGLGTSIVSALVSQLDGRLDVATGPNGTTVSIRSIGGDRGKLRHPSGLR